MNSASSSASDYFIGLAQVDQPLFRAGISCPVDRLFPGDLGHQSPEEDPPQGRQGARWAGTRALISLSLETSCARSLSDSAQCRLRALLPRQQLAPGGPGSHGAPAGCPTPTRHTPKQGCGDPAGAGERPPPLSAAARELCRRLAPVFELLKFPWQLSSRHPSSGAAGSSTRAPGAPGSFPEQPGRAAMGTRLL